MRRAVKPPVYNEAQGISLAGKAFFFMVFILWVVAIFLGVQPAKANSPYQLEVRLENQYFEDGSVFFDIYLQQKGSAILYLGIADFNFSLAIGNQKIQDIQLLAGSAQLFAANGLPANAYQQNLSWFEKDGNYNFSIAIEAPAINSEDDIYDYVAAIDQRVSFHRLGRIQLLGISDGFELQQLQLLLEPDQNASVALVFQPSNELKLIPSELLFGAEPANQGNPIRSFQLAQLGNYALISGLIPSDYPIQNLYFEKSFDQAHWQVLQVPVNDKGNLVEASDNNIKEGRLLENGEKVYYRMVVVNENGQLFISAAKSLAIRNALELSVYPNPAKDVLNIQLPQGELQNAIVAIYASDGRLVMEQALAMVKEIQLNLFQVAPGYYLVRVVAGELSGQARLIVQH
jgi:hypothetical protein